jgi:catechol 2,3-dioxygenase-like lactoylglutathione lyase family enzyme
MLGDHLVYPVLVSTDLARTRAFYHDRLGLEILSEDTAAIVFRCGKGSKLSVTSSAVGTADPQTQLAWEVDDVRAEVDELRRHGVTPQDYDMPGLRTDDGVADVGFGLAAWIVDPGGNVLGLIQPRR